MNLVASPFVASRLRCICLLILWYYQLHSHMWTVTCSAVIHSGWLAHSDTVHSDTQWYMWTCSTVIHSGWLVHAPAVSGGNGQCQPVFSLPLMSLSHDIQYHSYHISSYIFSITSQIFLDMSLNSKIQIKHFTKRFWKTFVLTFGIWQHIWSSLSGKGNSFIFISIWRLPVSIFLSQLKRLKFISESTKTNEILFSDCSHAAIGKAICQIPSPATFPYILCYRHMALPHISPFSFPQFLRYFTLSVSPLPKPELPFE